MRSMMAVSGSAGMLALAVLAHARAASAVGLQEEGHPIEKVISMLQDMQVQAKEDHNAEKAAYAKFAYWCKHADADLTKSINARKERLEILDDKIGSTKEEIKGLEEDIEKLEGELEERNAASEKAAKVREDQQKDYEDEKKDLEDTIAAFKEAITALEPHAGAASAVQMARPEVKRALLLAQVRRGGAEPIDAKGTGREVKYQSKSGGVVDMLKDLLAEFERDLVKNEQEETNSLNAYDLAKQAQDYAISEAEEAKKAKTTMKSDAEVKLSDLELEEGQDKDALEAEEKALDGAQADCDTRAAEWEERTKTRELEMAAIAKAVEILGKVVHVRNPDTHEIPSRGGSSAAAASFLQMGKKDALAGPKQKAVNLLKKEASKAHSKMLSKLAEAIASTAAGTPFDKINQMIQKMIFRLMAEQKDEDAHKAWCDHELEKTEDSKATKEEKMEVLIGKIESANTKVQTLTEDIAENTKEVAKITEYIQEETQIREENHKENKAAIKDAKDAQVAIAKAVDVLKDFYKKSGDMELLQGTRKKAPDAVTLPEQPSTWDAGYTGVSGDDGKPASAGVLAMLDEIDTKFAAMEAETKAQEETDEKDYQMDMADQKALKKDTEKESDLKADQKATLDQKLKAMSTEKRHLASELDAVEKYLKDLEPACVTGDSSYEDRKQARTDEIDALKQAQDILEGAFKKEDGFLQMPRPVKGHGAST